MIGRPICCLLLTLCVAGAVVEFPHSQTFDEYDFKGQSSVTTNQCSFNCRIYASITTESQKLAEKLLIQLPKGFVSVAEVAAMRDPTTGQKGYLEVQNTATLSIVNGNAQLAAGPLVLYVANVGTFMDSAEVYEADSFSRNASTVYPYAVTVMSARPFTIHGQAQAAGAAATGQSLFAIMSGYMMEGGCEPVFSETLTPFPAFTMEVNGPIVSLVWSQDKFHYSPGDMSATIGISHKRQLERSGWIGSPGYHGCTGKQPYRSSLYDFSKLFKAIVSSNHLHTIGTSVETNSDASHPVQFGSYESGMFNVSNLEEETHVTHTFKRTQMIEINWASYGTGDKGFLLRWHSVDFP